MAKLSLLNYMYDKIEIYHSIFKTTILFVVAQLFTVPAIYFLFNPDLDFNKKILFWSAILLFGVTALFVLGIAVYYRCRHIPYLIIYEDRLEIYVHLKRKYKVIPFSDVKNFRIIKIERTKQITIDFKSDLIHNKYQKNSKSKLKSAILAFNYITVGAFETIPVDMLTMKGNDIYRILNDRLQLLNLDEKKKLAE